MARNILIVDESDMMRRVLQTRILSQLDDAVIFEATGVKPAAQFLKKNTVHLLLYGWDIQDEEGFQFCKNVAAGKHGPAIPFLFLISDKKEYIDMAADLVGQSYVTMPCPAETLANAIDRVCSPVKLRQAKRYSIKDTRAVISQRQVRMEGTVVNVSSGGALCEFELDANFNSAFPATISILFNTDNGLIPINDLGAVATNMIVLTRHADQTSRCLRMGFKFIQLTELAKQTFEKIFSQFGE